MLLLPTTTQDENTVTGAAGDPGRSSPANGNPAAPLPSATMGEGVGGGVGETGTGDAGAGVSGKRGASAMKGDGGVAGGAGGGAGGGDTKRAKKGQKKAAKEINQANVVDVLKRHGGRLSSKVCASMGRTISENPNQAIIPK